MFFYFKSYGSFCVLSKVRFLFWDFNFFLEEEQTAEVPRLRKFNLNNFSSFFFSFDSVTRVWDRSEISGLKYA